MVGRSAIGSTAPRGSSVNFRGVSRIRDRAVTLPKKKRKKEKSVSSKDYGSFLETVFRNVSDVLLQGGVLSHEESEITSSL